MYKVRDPEWDSLHNLYVYYKVQDDDGKFILSYDILTFLKLLERLINLLVDDFYSTLKTGEHARLRQQTNKGTTERQVYTF